MKNCCYLKSIVVAIGATCALLIVLPVSVRAQGKSSPSARPAPTPRSPIDRDMYQREMNIKSLELEREKRAEPLARASDTTIKEVKEDFSRIQEINADMVRLFQSAGAPDYKHISQAMVEMKRRAERLRTNLVLPSSKEDSQEGRNPAAAKAGRSPLLDMNDLITGFVTNPIFTNANTIDAELGAKAKRDLDCIVDLSDRISKSADKLSQAAVKPK